jgi:hypothetical protein
LAVDVGWKEHAKGGALVQLTLDLNPAAMGFDDHLTLEHANAKAFFLGGLKRPKQGAIEEFGRHAASVILDGQHDPSVSLGGLDADAAVGGDGFGGVKDQVGDNFVDLIGVESEF